MRAEHVETFEDKGPRRFPNHNSLDEITIPNLNPITDNFLRFRIRTSNVSFVPKVAQQGLSPTDNRVNSFH